jgi:hypothetical protein
VLKTIHQRGSDVSNLKDGLERFKEFRCRRSALSCNARSSRDDALRNRRTQINEK